MPQMDSLESSVMTWKLVLSLIQAKQERLEAKGGSWSNCSYIPAHVTWGEPFPLVSTSLQRENSPCLTR